MSVEYALSSQYLYEPSSGCTKQEVDEAGTRESHQTAKRERKKKERREGDVCAMSKNHVKQQKMRDFWFVCSLFFLSSPLGAASFMLKGEVDMSRRQRANEPNERACRATNISYVICVFVYMLSFPLSYPFYCCLYFPAPKRFSKYIYVYILLL